MQILPKYLPVTAEGEKAKSAIITSSLYNIGLTHFYSPSPNALRWGIVDKLQRSEKKGILRKSCNNY